MALGAEVMGVEPSRHGVAMCLENKIPVFHGDLSAFNKTNPAQFDLVTSNHVIEHHPSPVLVLSEMRSLVTENGRIWFAVPNADCFFARRLRDQWHSCDLPVHLQHFSKESVKTAILYAGLKVEAITTESDNSMLYSLSVLLRSRLYVPRQITNMAFSKLLRKDGPLGRRIDAAGQGEAILVRARPNTHAA